MSLITDFNFRAFECDATRSRDGAVKKAVSLSVLTSEDMKRLAVVKVTVPCGRENPSTPWVPVAIRAEEHATFWDTRMGNFDLKPFPSVACTTCSGNVEGSGRAPPVNQRCSGHYGYIAMPTIGTEGGSMVVYNPIMFRDLYALLRSQCFFCHNLRAAPIDTMRWYLAFELFDHGLPAEALAFLAEYKSQGARTVMLPTGGGAAEAPAPVVDGDDAREKSKKKNRSEPAAAKPTRDEVSHSGIQAMKLHVAKVIRAAQASNRLPTGAARDAALRTVVDIRTQLAAEAFAELTAASKTCTHCSAETPTFTTKDGQIYIKLSKTAIDKLLTGKHITPEVKEEYLTEMRVFNRERILFPAHQALQHMMTLCARQTDLLSKLLLNVGTASVNVEYRNPLPPSECFKALFLDCILVPPVNLRLASGVKVQEGGSLAPDERTKTLSHILQFVKEIEAYYEMRQHSTPTLRQQVANEGNIRNLQLHVDGAYDAVLQSFAKKEGLFRMHMMGKRVNQACRSVISPDFTVEPNEVLLPRAFARNLSFPEQISFHDPARSALMRKCIINGPLVYPGATHVEIHESDKTVRAYALSDDQRDVSGRTARADSAIASARQGRKVIVYRHVLDGDRIIFNRQPTLHRPSMQSYEVKVLSSLKTLRFHYVSGKSYNADFDGDEMNVHVPQSMETRAELALIMDSNLQYLVPTSGKPIRGLIQDHCAAGVFLTMRDRFFERDEFVQLVYLGLQPYLGLRGASTDFTSYIPQPAILKPRPMWTGKQVFSIVLRFITGVDGTESGNSGVCLKGSSMIYTTTWTTRDGSTVASHKMADEPLLVVGSELLVGVLDKNQLGPQSMSIAHALYEVYGPHHVGRFFGAMGRILTYSLRYVGFSMGVEDMILVDGESRRAAAREIDLCTIGVTDEGQALAAVSKAASSFQSKFIPAKLRMHFPANDLVTMTQSGAKGSNTNAIQMALTLGQQTFSGQRIGAMTSGKTAPSFFKHETRARSKGFAMGRFVSGIRPAEYTIHAMAGRDGLIDTAVKTARSGYLQRCLVKGLESLTTQWDGTVRDANGAVTQFKFGGDGLDPCKASTVDEFDMVFKNRADFARRYKVGPFAPEAKEQDCFDSDDGEKNGMSAEEWQREAQAKELAVDLPPHLESKLRRQTFNLDLKPRTVLRWRQKGVYAEKLDEEQRKAAATVAEITKARLARACSEPGEPVGIVAAQAAGEPSTQMTLNTFHQAGQTVTHVTEGIPRLRELLMFASVAQPAVIIPVASTANGELEVVQAIIGRLTPKRLKNALAPLSKPYRWNVTRTESGATLNIAMLFSRDALERMRKASGASQRDFVVSFGAALRNFSKRLCMRLKGVVRSAGTTVRKTVTDPAELLKGDEEGEAVHRRARNSDNDDDDDDEDEDEDDAVENDGGDADSEAAAPALKSKQQRQRSATPAPDDEDDDAPAKENGEGDDDDDDDDDDAALVDQLMGAGKSTGTNGGASSASATGVDYTRFPALDDYFVSRTMHSVIVPMPASKLIDSGAAPTSVIDDLCAAKFTISMPGNVVSVIPDVVKLCMDEVKFPTSNAQVDEALWLPDKGKDSGQLILQGNGAKLKTALSVVAPYADRYPGLSVRSIESTDVRDIAETFGIEAAYKFLSKELQKLFKRHSVDARHCSLIADTATYRGIWHAFNFNGMIAHSSSPLFQMTFASSRKFLERAISRGVPDDLNSFSAAIMVGEKPKVGTGTVGLSVDASVVSQSITERASGSRSGLKPMKPLTAEVPTLA
jgi:DNA-directed RNA polymerase I subunit RPA1